MKKFCNHRATGSMLFLLTLITTLSACGQDQSLAQLNSWIQSARQQSQPDIPAQAPLPEQNRVTAFKPLAYLAQHLPSPFDEEPATDSAQPVNAMHPRPPQRGAPHILENYPLDSMRLAGTMMRGRERVALVHIAGKLNQVRPGDYLGLRFGMVEHISENRIVLEELERDTDGNWITLHTTLAMEEQQR